MIKCFMHTTVAGYKRKSIICTLILTTVAPLWPKIQVFSTRILVSRPRDLVLRVIGPSNVLTLKKHSVNTASIEVHKVEGSKNLWFSKSYIFHPFQALYCRARCADSKKVSYVGVGPRKVGLKRAKLPLASAK